MYRYIAESTLCKGKREGGRGREGEREIEREIERVQFTAVV